MPLSHTLSCLLISSTIFSKGNIKYLFCAVLSNFSLNQFILCVSLRNNFVHDILFIMSDHHLLFCHIEFRFRTTSYHHRNIFLTKQMTLLLTYYSYINFTSFFSKMTLQNVILSFLGLHFCHYFIFYLQFLSILILELLLLF